MDIYSLNIKYTNTYLMFVLTIIKNLYEPIIILTDYLILNGGGGSNLIVRKSIYKRMNN